MEHYIIDPIRDSGEGGEEEESVASSESDALKRFRREPTILDRVGTALGLSSDRTGRPRAVQNRRGFLLKKSPRLREWEERRPLICSMLSPSSTEEGDGQRVLKRSTTLMQHIAARSKTFVVYAISKEGSKEMYLKTFDILSLIHSHNKANKPEESAPGAVKVRDLRMFLSSGRDLASITARRNCILVSWPYVRIIVLHELVLLLPIGKGNFPREARRFEQTEWRCELLKRGLLTREEDEEVAGPVLESGSKISSLWGSTKPHPSASLALLRTHQENFNSKDECPALTDIDVTLLQKLEQLVALKTSTPFEYLALEAAIVESHHVMERQIRAIRQTATTICADLRTGRGVNSTILLSVNSLHKILDGLKSEVAGVLSSLNDVLSDDQCIRRMAISQFWSSPELWEEEGKEAFRQSGHVALKHELDMLLSCYSQDADVMMKNVRNIDEYIDDSLAMIELYLGMQRNFLLKADVWMTTLATVIGFFALVPTIFGMNIQHGLEKSPYATVFFWSIAASIFTATIITGIVVSCLLRKLRI
ncbi:family mg2+ transporter protein [Cystoisospora suis]|uniref:Family mg2+ transporter protein n=1 Tax=Cystoisospora suis TaxID=483139 RepID=A0A2C6L3I4_9APIC|nr:family mg2+ transporter protein [Cystoisospora suis]